MRFQSLFLIGLILSVIFIFPIVAFADKGEHGKKPSTHPGSENPVAEKAGKQAYHPKKVEIHLPEQANKNAKGNKDKQTTKQLPEQASEKAVQAVDKVKQKNQNKYHETRFSYTFSFSIKKRNHHVAFYTNWNQPIFLFYKKLIRRFQALVK